MTISLEIALLTRLILNIAYVFQSFSKQRKISYAPSNFCSYKKALKFDAVRMKIVQKVKGF